MCEVIGCPWLTCMGTASWFLAGTLSVESFPVLCSIAVGGEYSGQCIWLSGEMSICSAVGYCYGASCTGLLLSTRFWTARRIFGVESCSLNYSLCCWVIIPDGGWLSSSSF